MFQFPPLPPTLDIHRKVAFAFAGMFLGIEILFQLSDAGVIMPGLRWEGYALFSFYDPWFDAFLAGQPAPDQVYWSPLSYAFLHANMTHVLLNTAPFLGLSLMVMRIFGVRLFLVFFFVTAVGGSLTYGLMSRTDAPMVGASGVVFGLIGVLKYAEFAFLSRGPGHGAWDAWKAFASTLVVLALINVALALFMSGMLAWQTHLGGFLAGWVAAWAVVPKAQKPAQGG